jgi:hypothetical protein
MTRSTPLVLRLVAICLSAGVLGGCSHDVTECAVNPDQDTRLVGQMIWVESIDSALFAPDLPRALTILDTVSVNGTPTDVSRELRRDATVTVRADCPAPISGPCVSMAFGIGTIVFRQPMERGSTSLASLNASACPSLPDSASCFPVAGELDVTDVVPECSEGGCAQLDANLRIDEPATIGPSAATWGSARIVHHEWRAQSCYTTKSGGLGNIGFGPE